MYGGTHGNFYRRALSVWLTRAHRGDLPTSRPSPRRPLHVPVAQQSADTPEAEGGATAGGDPSVRACVVPASPGLGAIASAFSRCSVPVCV